MFRENKISIHVPLAGHDERRCAFCGKENISIHVPLAGHDEDLGEVVYKFKLFQSTCPLRGTTAARTILECALKLRFQSTCPLRGTTRLIRKSHRKGVFQSTCPLRGTTAVACPVVRDDNISIHVPLAGHDFGLIAIIVNKKAISIHVPLAGHDRLPHQLLAVRQQFQSTCPLRGTTRRKPRQKRILLNFNPRAPCGARLQLIKTGISRRVFQSTCPLRGTTRCSFARPP